MLQLLGRFSNIGRSKAVGYLPLKTIKNIFELDAAALATPCAGQGLCTRIFKIDECCIGSGALYIYSVPDLQPNLSAWSQTLVNNGWSVSTGDFIDRTTKLWLPETDPIQPVIPRVIANDPWYESLFRPVFGEGPIKKRINLMACAPSEVLKPGEGPKSVVLQAIRKIDLEATASKPQNIFPLAQSLQ